MSSEFKYGYTKEIHQYWLRFNKEKEDLKQEELTKEKLHTYHCKHLVKEGLPLTNKELPSSITDNLSPKGKLLYKALRGLLTVDNLN